MPCHLVKQEAKAWKLRTPYGGGWSEGERDFTQADAEPKALWLAPFHKFWGPKINPGGKRSSFRDNFNATSHCIISQIKLYHISVKSCLCLTFLNHFYTYAM